MTEDHSQTIEAACRLIAANDVAGAERTIRDEYPFESQANAGRRHSTREMARIFYRDGFIDRYRGTRLVFPPVLRMLSLYLPDVFPYHPNGKFTACHFAFWELFPTIDHIQPIARGGPDSEENWVCCSMLTNSIKANWTLEELQWQLQPPGDPRDWDGMVGWFIERLAADPEIARHSYIKRWPGVALELAALHAEPIDTAA
jgi:hypothetical protein